MSCGWLSLLLGYYFSYCHLFTGIFFFLQFVRIGFSRYYGIGNRSASSSHPFSELFRLADLPLDWHSRIKLMKEDEGRFDLNLIGRSIAVENYYKKKIKKLIRRGENNEANRSSTRRILEGRGRGGGRSGIGLAGLVPTFKVDSGADPEIFSWRAMCKKDIKF